MKTHILIGALAALVFAGPANADTLVTGFDSNTLPPNDDGSTGEVALGFTANFFGTDYTGVYVNNNGNLTFGSPLSTFTPFGVGAGYTGNPIIAPFFADVDTRVGNPVTYGTGSYMGYNAFGATWEDVGYFNLGQNLLNSFQVIITDRSDITAGDFDIYFNYESILWETGNFSGGSGGLGGFSATAGYSNGTGVAGTYYQLPGSGVNGAFLDGGPNSLASGGNTGTPGLFLFQVRSGQVVAPGVPEPGTWMMLLLGFFAMGGVLRRRKQAEHAMSVSYS